MKRFVLLTLVILACFAGATSAKGLGGSSIMLDQPNPHFGDAVTFTTSTSKTATPWIELMCFGPAGQFYAAQTAPAFPSPQGYPFVFVLGPTANWPSGEADCTATLFSTNSGHRKDLASVGFHVDA